jgi:hypothetical protein
MKTPSQKDPKQGYEIPLHFKWDDVDRAEAFFQAYDFQKTIFYNPDEKQKLTLKTERLCRYCHKSMPEVTFRKDAHLYPEFTGNRYLLSDSECDVCNELFGKYENHLANFLGPVFALQGILGKKRTGRGRDVSFTTPDGRLKVEPIKMDDGTKGIIISKADENDPSIQIARAEGTTYIQYTKHDYVPLKVYKLLIKMMFASLPEKELVHYATIPEYLLTDKLDKHFEGCQHVIIHRKPFTLGHRAPIAQLFKKRDPNRRLPTHIFVIMFANLVVQLYLSDHTADIPLIYGSGVIPEIMPILPPFFATREQADETQYQTVPYMFISSGEVKGETEKMIMQTDSEILKQAVVYDPETDGKVPLENFGETMKILLFEEGKIMDTAQVRDLLEKASKLGPKKSS